MVLLLGNCQLQRLKYICLANGREYLYLPNTDRLDASFNVDRAIQAVRNADIVVAQPIMNMENPLNYQALLREAKEVIFFPYVYIDGIFSLSALEVGSSNIHGQDCIEGFYKGSFDDLINSFRFGNINFNNKSRFENSLNELIERENIADTIRISDVIYENYHNKKILVSHNHPDKWLMDILSSRLFDRLGWNYRPYANSSHAQRVDYMFDLGEVVLSPYDIDAMELQFPSDDQWWNVGRILLTRLWNRAKPIN